MKTYLADNCKYGRFLLLEGDLISQFMRVYGEWCPAEVDLYLSVLKARPGNVIEVGSHIGTHTVPLARELSGSPYFVTALEPQRVIFQLLCANVALNGLTNVHAYQSAAGSKWHNEDEVPVGDYDLPFNYGAFSVPAGLNHETPYPGPMHDETVTIGPVDGFNPGQTSLLKVDCEGYQTAVLDGSVLTLKADRPVIVIESPGPKLAGPLITRLENFSYECYWFVAARYSADNTHQLAWGVPGMDVSLACVPVNDSRWQPVGLTRAKSQGDGSVDNVKLEVLSRYDR